MPLKPAILELGTGVSLHGRSHTEAAQRAVWDAIHHGSILFVGLFDQETAESMVVEVTVAVPEPDQVDHQVVLSALPYGGPTLRVVQGGMAVEGREGSGDWTIMANAAVIVKLDVD
ncbi:MAG TPA: hypothetical protein DCP37_07605 [Dehalococcoidia bacterium]|jgi:uncharacterized protein (TIGR02058 family)|nr:hypothetical protein [Dehalococcoidia bacterium]|tara:strand:+ start:5311 stop:5658 length:348 start_codon:yes stop_codon:yes gene_type:complete